MQNKGRRKCLPEDLRKERSQFVLVYHLPSVFTLFTIQVFDCLFILFLLNQLNLVLKVMILLLMKTVDGDDMSHQSVLVSLNRLNTQCIRYVIVIAFYIHAEWIFRQKRLQLLIKNTPKCQRGETFLTRPCYVNNSHWVLESKGQIYQVYVLTGSLNNNMNFG